MWLWFMVRINLKRDDEEENDDDDVSDDDDAGADDVDVHDD